MTASMTISMTKAQMQTKIEEQAARIAELESQDAIATSRFYADVVSVKDGFVRFSREVEGNSLKVVPSNVGFMTRGAYVRIPEGTEIRRGSRLIVSVTVESIEDVQVSNDLS